MSARTASAIAVVAGALLGGCATLAPDAAPAGAPASERDAQLEALESRCIAFLRDVRRYCREGLSNAESANRYRCLDARINLERECS